MGGSEFGWSRVLGNHQGGAISVRQIHGDSDLKPAAGWVRHWLSKETVVPVGTELPLQPLPRSQIIHFLFVCNLLLFSCCPSTGTERSESVVSKSMFGTFNPCDFSSPLSHGTESLLIFTSRDYGDVFSQDWNPGLGIQPGVGLGSLTPQEGSLSFMCFYFVLFFLGFLFAFLFPLVLFASIVYVSYYYYNKSPQTWCLKTTHLYYLTVQ